MFIPTVQTKALRQISSMRRMGCRTYGMSPMTLTMSLKEGDGIKFREGY